MTARSGHAYVRAVLPLPKIPTKTLGRLNLRLGLFLALNLGFLGEGAAEVTRGPYLQLSTEDSVIVVWRSDVATTAVVRYGRSADKLDQREGKDFALKVAAGTFVLQVGKRKFARVTLS